MADKFLKALRPTLTGGSPGWVLQAGYFFAAQSGVFMGAAGVLVPAANVTPSLLAASWFTMTFAANTAVAFGIPTGVPAGLTAFFAITIINTSGAPLTNITWAAAYKMAAQTYPATANNRSFIFATDGTNAYELVQTAADVAN